MRIEQGCSCLIIHSNFFTGACHRPTAWGMAQHVVSQKQHPPGLPSLHTGHEFTAHRSQCGPWLNRIPNNWTKEALAVHSHFAGLFQRNEMWVYCMVAWQLYCRRCPCLEQAYHFSHSLCPFKCALSYLQEALRGLAILGYSTEVQQPRPKYNFSGGTGTGRRNKRRGSKNVDRTPTFNFN